MQEEGLSFKNLSKFTNSKYALGVGNCTDGLLLSIKAAGIGSGDEVIFCSHTFVATASAKYIIVGQHRFLLNVVKTI